MKTLLPAAPPRLLPAALLVGLALSLAFPVRAAEVRRVAVVVGSNRAAPGLAPLKYSQRDAQSMADILIDAGDFPRADVHVLIDPEPAAVLTALDVELQRARASRDETMLLFYYSGHADDRALYPGGRPLPYTDLKPRLESAAAALRIGVIDACSGGAWTRSKGLHPDVPFFVTVPLEMDAEGSVLIASSSGTENAHETDLLQGSFFTHHLVAGLRGAAARSDRGDISLHDAFTYAQQLTVRDTARLLENPQHPSFDMRVRGRHDIALTRVERSASVLALEQDQGPLQLVQLSTGVIVAELPSGKRTTRLAVPPGEYLVRRLDVHGNWSRQVTVETRQTVSLSEASLELSGEPALAAKEFRPRPQALDTTVRRHHVQLSFSAGLTRSEVPLEGGGNFGPSLVNTYGTIPLRLGLEWGVTDRLQLSLPGIAYRFGDVGGTEWVPWAGITGFVATGGSAVSLGADGGIFIRKWFGADRALNVGLDVLSSPRQSPDPRPWEGHASAGWSQTFDNRITLNFGALYGTDLDALRPLIGRRAGSSRFASSLTLGGTQGFGSRLLPLVQVHLSGSTSLDGNLWTRFGLSEGGLTAGFSLGIAHTF